MQTGIRKNTNVATGNRCSYRHFGDIVTPPPVVRNTIMSQLENQPPMTKIIQEVGFDFHWSSKKVWALDEPVVDMPIDDLLWHFDIPFWDTEGTDEYNLKPWELIEHPEQEPSHYKKIQAADLRYPIDIMMNKGRWLILDGLHRLVKAYLEGKKVVHVRKIPQERIPEILSDTTSVSD